jgi:hypothetical protein
MLQYDLSAVKNRFYKPEGLRTASSRCHSYNNQIVKEQTKPAFPQLRKKLTRAAGSAEAEFTHANW